MLSRQYHFPVRISHCGPGIVVGAASRRNRPWARFPALPAATAGSDGPGAVRAGHVAIPSSGPPPLPVTAARRRWAQQIGALFEVTYVDETQPVTCVVLSVK